MKTGLSSKCTGTAGPRARKRTGFVASTYTRVPVTSSSRKLDPCRYASNAGHKVKATITAIEARKIKNTPTKRPAAEASRCTESCSSSGSMFRLTQIRGAEVHLDGFETGFRMVGGGGHGAACEKIGPAPLSTRTGERTIPGLTSRWRACGWLVEKPAPDLNVPPSLF